MRKKISFILHLFTLSLIFVASVWAFLYYRQLPLMQLYVVTLAVVTYVAWGAIYHFLNKRLTLELLLEYILVGALVLLLFFWTFFS
ncbi:hypothetical protein COT70_00900 [candidate division WWE3 bacterium CG09_land_8_20_14_0_10_47_33]|uniref:Uncharacterized protein n=1 Tax=candidate division WWE3 bacterium CG_4_9_14_0_2_um_filter_48_10 TaxID=1975078 RepID=A0A2M8EJ21_UNCKA|nr:MAG: hypothetical protein COT70_00900 [candidate division WWE3 bacterium CG09_land_8_20_14_0_10_47_33]PJC22749.1 MAG: hypothetical protein CO059_01730 [candidate division WWE3 bacterium CG_4_9_14_0_2_um_filter_48_10]PJE50573.1 MAG: hypothetical protein COV28_02995 [candidate division WWE3 bacterium CG10_big_fil_rev_8_21_14_0_10_48_23]